MKPLLAATVEDVDNINYPVLISPKLDGIRVLIKDGVAVTRSLKPVRNKFIQSVLGNEKFNGLDGEIIVGGATDERLFRTTNSGVMSEEGEPDFSFWVFDNYLIDKPFEDRLNSLYEFQSKIINRLDHAFIEDRNMLLFSHELYNERGFEGTMIRDPQGVYKFGRSTLNEGILMKLKEFLQEEARVVGFNERMHNANKAKTNELGYTERSTCKENLVGRGDLGSLEVERNGIRFCIGSGFTDAERKEIWNNKYKYLGQLVTFKFMEYGEYDAPRFPVFKGFRDKSDMS